VLVNISPDHPLIHGVLETINTAYTQKELNAPYLIIELVKLTLECSLPYAFDVE